MEITDRYLVTLYWKTKNRPAEGASSNLIRRLLHIPLEASAVILYALMESEVIRTGVGSSDNIVITGKGITSAKNLIQQYKVSILIFYSALYIPPTDKLAFGFNYFYHLISPDGSQENRSVGVFVSDVVAITQSLSFVKDGRGEKLLLQYGRDWVSEKLQEGALGQHEERLILTKDLETIPEYDNDFLVKVFEATFLVIPPAQPIREAIASNQLAALLIETRDAVNALFYDQHSSRLLLVPQERNLLDFFKDATTSEEFAIRVMSLGAISREMNIETLRKLTGIIDATQGSVALLKTYLSAKAKIIDPVIKPLQHFGRIRNGYPAHSDYTNVVESYRYFGITYPVEDFSKSWNILLNHYLVVLQELKRILLQK